MMNCSRPFGRVACAVTLFALAMLAGCSGPTTPEPQRQQVAAIISIDSIATLDFRVIDIPVRIQYPEAAEPILDSLGIGAFDLRFHYDSSQLVLQNVFRGANIADWDSWEWHSSMSTFCPPSCNYRHLRIIANRGQGGDGPDYPDEGVVAVLRFYLQTMLPLGSCIDLSFYLVECHDNTVWAAIADSACYMPDTSAGSLIIDDGYDPAECDYSRDARAVIGLRSGRICLEAPEPEYGCDLNGDGRFYEPADSALLTDYFLQGLSALDSAIVDHADSLADCNFDDENLSVADLEFLVHIMHRDVVFDPPHLIIDPYTSAADIKFEGVGGDCMVSVNSDADVGTVWFEIAVPYGRTPALQWVGDTIGTLSARQSGDVLRVLVTHWASRHQAGGTDWPHVISISDFDMDTFLVTSIQASSYPGVPMNVNVVR